uniref:Tigger transposable element-derived protein 4 n=1 Tax=Lygus hesperus TaxID=30085 RepID=A0A0A9XUX5_LYGHE
MGTEQTGKKILQMSPIRSHEDLKPPSSTAVKRKLNMLSLSEKLELIKAVEGCPGKTNNQFAKEFRIPPATMSRILKEKHKIMQVAMQGYSKRKRLRPAKYPELEKKLMEWLCNTQEIKAPVSGKYLKVKAMQVAALLKINNFVASNGWLEGFKKRCGNLRNLTVTRDYDRLCDDEPASNFVEQILEEGSEILCKEDINPTERDTVGMSPEQSADRISSPEQGTDSSCPAQLPATVKIEPQERVVTQHEAQIALDTVRTYFQSMEGAPDTIFHMLETIKRCVDHEQT